jgi:hypothetical protein
MGTPEQHQRVLELYHQGRIAEASQLAEQIVFTDIRNAKAQSPDQMLQRMRKIQERTPQREPVGIKSGVQRYPKPRPEWQGQRKAKILSEIIERETGQVISCSSCTSELAKLNRISSAQALIELEDLADKVLRILTTPVDRVVVKAWLCEAIERGTDG